MKNKMVAYGLRTVVPSLVITFLVLLAVSPVSCRSPQESLLLLEGEYDTPRISGIKVLSSKKVELYFTLPVEVRNLVLLHVPADSGTTKEQDQSEKNATPLSAQWSFSDGEGETGFGKTVHMVSDQEMLVGETYEIEGTCTDENGNSLTFTIPFLGFNSRVPQLVISELRNAYGWSTSGGEKRRRGEFVELYMLTSGNLSGVKIFSANDGEKTSFVLPNVEVEEGEYVVVHMRSFSADDLLSGEKMESETGTDLAMSSTKDSSASRDLWNPKTASCFATSDIIVLQNLSDGRILDALEYAQEEMKEWPESYAQTVSLVNEAGAWKGEPLCTEGLSATSLTKSISRNNIQKLKQEKEREASSAVDFTVATKVSPGLENLIQ